MGLAFSHRHSFSAKRHYTHLLQIPLIRNIVPLRGNRVATYTFAPIERFQLEIFFLRFSERNATLKKLLKQTTNQAYRRPFSAKQATPFWSKRPRLRGRLPPEKKYLGGIFERDWMLYYAEAATLVCAVK